MLDPPVPLSASHSPHDTEFIKSYWDMPDAYKMPILVYLSYGTELEGIGRPPTVDIFEARLKTFLSAKSFD